MARDRIRPGRRLTDISDAIIAEWYRVLPPKSVGGPPLAMDANALTGAFNQILESRCQAILDEAGKPIKVVVPLPPAANREDLEEYLENNGDFRLGMGAAVLFGCGR